MISLLTMMIPAVVVHENLTIYPIVPLEAGQGWKLELFELAETLPLHYHKIQRQWIVAVEGSLKVLQSTKPATTLQSSGFVCIDPGTPHSVIPEGRARFLAIDLPGFHFPEDVFYGEPELPIKWFPTHDKSASVPLNERYFGQGVVKGDYTVYELVNGNATEETWSAALLEIKNSHKHFHRIENELFIVVGGTLDIEVDGRQHLIQEGEAIAISPGSVHQLKSANETPVRVLCFNFPAFDPTDIYCVE